MLGKLKTGFEMAALTVLLLVNKARLSDTQKSNQQASDATLIAIQVNTQGSDHFLLFVGLILLYAAVGCGWLSAGDQTRRALKPFV